MGGIGVTDLPDDASTRVARIRRTLLDDVWRAGTVFAPIIMVGATLRDFHFHGLSWSTVVTSILGKRSHPPRRWCFQAVMSVMG